MKSKDIKRKRRNTQGVEDTLDKTLKNAFFGLLISAGISLLLLLVGTAAAFFTGDPTALVEPLGYVILFISTFFGGFACGKLNRRSPLLTSALCGFGFVILSMLISFVLPHTLASHLEAWQRLLMHLASFLCFPLGAIANKKADKKPKKRRKTR